MKSFETIIEETKAEERKIAFEEGMEKGAEKERIINVCKTYRMLRDMKPDMTDENIIDLIANSYDYTADYVNETLCDNYRSCIKHARKSFKTMIEEIRAEEIRIIMKQLMENAGTICKFYKNIKSINPDMPDDSIINQLAKIFDYNVYCIRKILNDDCKSSITN